MKVSKEYILALSALIAVLGLVGGGYQFYYRERLDEYKKNIEDENKLADVLNKLQANFQECPPEDLISAVNGEVNPMVEELHRRAAVYKVDDLFEILPIPEDKMRGFYYREEFTRLFNEFRQEQMRTYPNCWYPPSITFGAPLPDQFTGVAVEKQEVEAALKKITFGLSMIRMLMVNKAIYVADVALWPSRMTRNDKLYTEFTVGLSFAMMPKDLVAFLDTLRNGEILGQKRFASVDAVSIHNRYLRWPTEPPLEVEMLLTFAHANTEGIAGLEGTPAAGGGGTATAAAGGPQNAEAILAAWKSKAGGGMGRPGRGGREEAPLTGWGKFKRFMKRWFWPF